MSCSCGLCEWERSEVGELRVWELKQRLCQVIASEEYFAWQLHDDRRLLQDHYLVANIAGNMAQGLSLLAIKRRLQPRPWMNEQISSIMYLSVIDENYGS